MDRSTIVRLLNNFRYHRINETELFIPENKILQIADELIKLFDKHTINMKRSEQLKKQLENPDINDLQALGMMNQIIREKRIENWDEWKILILRSSKVKYYEEIPQQGKWSLEIYNPNGDNYTIDYYPKANKVLIRKDNKWIKPGLNWLINNLLENDR